MSIEKHPTREGHYYVKHYPQGRKGKPERIPIEGYAAAQALDRSIKAAKGSTTAVTATFPRMSVIIDDYLLWVKQNQAPNTYRNKCERLLKFIIPALGQYRVQDLNQRILDQYGNNLTRSMYRWDVVHIMALIRWMIKRQYAANLTWKPELPVVISKVKPLPSPAGVLETIAAVPYETARQLFTLMLYTGLRPNEARMLRWENWQGDSFIISEAETHIAEIIPVPEQMQPWFAAHEKKNGWVFPSCKLRGRPYSNLHGILTKASLTTGHHLTPHMIRHCSATFLLESNGGDIYEVQHHLRHSRVTTTETYLRRSPTQRKNSIKSIDNYLKKNS